jgi:hypothetical protein
VTQVFLTKKCPNNREDCSCGPVGPRRKLRQLGALINYCSDIFVSFLIMSQAPPNLLDDYKLPNFSPLYCYSNFEPINLR